MARRSSGYVTRRGVARRETEWIGIDDVDINLTAASTASLTHTLSAGALALRPFTIVRTRMFWHVGSDQTAARERYLVSLSIAVVSEQATAIGVTAVPTPQTDQESDLFFLYESLGGTVDPTAGGFEEGWIQQVDSKAMRRVPEGADIAVVLETGSISLGAQVGMTGRMLIKLH